jgi:hypothetical protein
LFAHSVPLNKTGTILTVREITPIKKSLDIKRMIVESNREYQKRAMASYRLCVPSESYFTSVPAKEYPNVAQCPIHHLFVISPDEMKPFGNVLSEALSTKQPWYAEVYPTNK